MLRPIYRFGDCTIDASARELRNHGALATLSPKVFDCLIYLIEHRERAVGRDELISAVWGKLDVTDTLLGQTVLKARRAVGDSGNGQNFIRTIPRFGYRWVAEILVEDSTEPKSAPIAPIETIPPAQRTTFANAESASITPAPADPVRERASTRVGTTPRSRHRFRIAAALLLAVLVSASAWVWLDRTKHHEAPAASSSAAVASASGTAAVLPVSVRAGEEWAWLRLGLMDLIAARLRRAGQAVVPSDNVVALVRAGVAGATDDDAMHAVRDATGARYIIVPQIVRGANDWDVGIELRTPDGATREVHAQGPDPIDTARSAGDRLLALLGKIPPAEHEGAGELSLAELQQRTEAAVLSDDFVTARKLIETAAPALRDAPVMRLRLGQIDYRSGQLAPARTNFETLLTETSAENDPVLRARTLYGLGAVSLRQDRNDDAMRNFGEAIALMATRSEPAVLGQAYTGLAAALVNLGRFDEAADNLGRARVAVELAGDTLALARVDANEGVLDNARGRPAEALPILQRAAERFRQFGALNELFLTVAAQMKAHLALLDPVAALAVSEPVWAVRAKLDNPGSRTAFELQRARALAAAGHLTDARTLLEELGRGASPEATGLPGDVASESARVYLAAGDAQAAMDAARIAVTRLPTVDEARERARAWLTWTRALRATGRAADARDQVAEFSRWAATHDAMPSVTLFAALAAAEQARAEGRRQDEYRSYSLALTDAERWAVPADLATVAVSYGGSLIADADFEKASAVIGRVARWSDRDFDCALLQAGLYHALGQRTTWQTALARARSLAGERAIPADLQDPPVATPARTS
jgi:DNA-binding winged helix-turn-helix (wHTH) protein/tetratricopeptide (TPR) repeat protein